MFIDENLESIGLQKKNKVMITCSQPHCPKLLSTVWGYNASNQCSLYKFTYIYLQMWIIPQVHFAFIFNLQYSKYFPYCWIIFSIFQGTDVFSLDYQIKKWQQPTQQQLCGVNESNFYLFFVILAKINIGFGVLQNCSH